MLDLFNFLDEGRRFEVLRLGAAILRGYALDQERAIVDALHSILEASPFRRMVTPGDHTMSVTTTNCGAAGALASFRRLERMGGHFLAVAVDLYMRERNDQSVQR
jgi:alkylated DNA repair dioxygenase AlkB